MNELPPDSNEPAKAEVEFDENGMIKIPDWSQASQNEGLQPEFVTPEQPHLPELAADNTATVRRSDGSWDSGWKIENRIVDTDGKVTYNLSKVTSEGVLSKSGVASEKVQARNEATAEAVPQSFYVKRSDGRFDSGWKVAGVLERKEDGTASKFLMSKTGEGGTVLEKSVSADNLIQWQEAPREQLELEPRAESTAEELGEEAVEATPVKLVLPHANNFHAERASTPTTDIREIQGQLDGLAAEKQPSYDERLRDIHAQFDELVKGLPPETVQKLWKFGSATAWEFPDALSNLPQELKANGVADQYRALMREQSDLFAAKRESQK